MKLSTLIAPAIIAASFALAPVAEAFQHIAPKLSSETGLTKLSFDGFAYNGAVEKYSGIVSAPNSFRVYERSYRFNRKGSTTNRHGTLYPVTFVETGYRERCYAEGVLSAGNSGDYRLDFTYPTDQRGYCPVAGKTFSTTLFPAQ